MPKRPDAPLTIDELAAHTRRLVAASGLSHAAVAERTGMARPTVTVALSRPSRRYGATYLRILAALGETWAERWARVE